jgi:hypothetical protein
MATLTKADITTTFHITDSQIPAQWEKRCVLSRSLPSSFPCERWAFYLVGNGKVAVLHYHPMADDLLVTVANRQWAANRYQELINGEPGQLRSDRPFTPAKQIWKAA